MIPIVYRLWHLYLEPAFSLSGALHLTLAPEKYHAYTPSSTPYLPAAQHTYRQLAACYLLIAVFEAVFLRNFQDRKIWRYALTCMLVCDGGHLLADVCEEWPPQGPGWVALGVTVLGIVVRMCFVFGVGMNKGDEDGAMEKES